MKLNRRSLLVGMPLVPASARAFGLGEAERAFEAVVRQMGGIGDISPYLLEGVAAEFLTLYGTAARNAFADWFSTGALEERLAQADPAMVEQARFVSRLLYTGEVMREGKAVALYYPWSLAWKALTFATAPGLCGGPAFGHWANPPVAGDM